MKYTNRIFPVAALIALAFTPATAQSIPPFLNTISPSSAPAGAPTFILTASGVNFGSLAVVLWNGQPIETIKTSDPNVLQAIVEDSLVAEPGQALVSVYNGIATSNALVFTITQPQPPIGPPTLSSVTPFVIAAGSPETVLVLTGENFSANATVTWNNTQLSTEFVSPTRLNARVPRLLLATAGIAAVTVSQGNYVSSAVRVYVVDKPVIEELSPSITSRGAPAFTMVVQGVNFVQSSSVLWNDTPLATSYVNANRILAQVPASLLTSAGESRIIVSNELRPDPQIPTLSVRINSDFVRFRIIDGPSIWSLEPASTTAGSGELKLLVRGAMFASSAVVNWNNTQLPTVFRSSGELEATVSASLVTNITTAAITVTSLQAASNSLPFQVVQGPAIHRLIPDSATRGSAAFTMRIVGTGFTQNSRVLWDTTALPATYISSSELRVPVDAALLGQAKSVRVTVVEGQFSSLPARFNITTGPAIWSLDPSSAFVGSPALTLTVSGTGFAPGAQVRWDGNALPTEFVSTSTLRAAVSETLLSRAGSVRVTVTLQQISSMPASFAVLERTTPPPPPLSLTSVSPDSAFAGGQGVTLTVTGTGFVQSSVVRWNDTALQTTYVSATSLTAAVPASLLTAPGSAQIRVTRDQTVAGPLNFTIRPGMTLTSLSPNFAVAGGPSFTLTVTGTGFVSGAVVRWNQIELYTEFVSATRLDAAVSEELIASAGSATVSVSSLNFTTAALPFAIESRLAISALSPSSVFAGSPAFTLAVSGSGFTPRSVVRWNQSALTTRYNSPTSLSADVPAAFVAAAGTAAVSVVNPSSNASNPAEFATRAVQLPTVVIQGISDTANPTEQPVIRLGLSGEFTIPLSGRITISFDSDAVDRADSVNNVRLENGGREFRFNITDPNAPMPSVGLQVGTIAGRITVNVIIETAGGVQLNPPSVTTRVVTVARAAPVLTRACLARTSTGFDAVVIGYSTPREITRAVYRFTASTGANLQTLDLTPAGTSAAFSAWFATDASKSLGSVFRLVQSFTISGDQNAVQSASVVLSNSAGDSAARTATFETNCPNN